MKKHLVMFGIMAAGAAAVVGKRTYDLLQLKKAAEKQENVIEIEVQTDDPQNQQAPL